MAVVAVPFILYLVRFCSSKSCKTVPLGNPLGTRHSYCTVLVTPAATVRVVLYAVHMTRG